MSSRQLHGFLTRRILYPVNLWHKGLSRARIAEWRCRDRMTPAQVLELQGRELRKLLLYAQEHCAFYARQFADRGVNARADDPFCELGKLPPLSKADIRNNITDLLADRFRKASGLIKKATGGSTGTPLEIWGDVEDYRLNGLVIARQRAWLGWQGGMQTVSVFGGYRDVPSWLTRQAKSWLINDTLINNMARENGDYDRMAARLLKSPPEVLVAYFSSLRELARALERKNQPLEGIKLAIACAEPINEPARRDAEKWIGAKIYFQYGCRELGTFAQECCQQQGYHYAQDIALCEILDEHGRPADYGHLTITYFGNLVVPLIRYQIGDGAALDKSPCPCGLPYQRLKVIDGRVSSMVRTPGGQQLTSMIFPHLLKDSPWIAEYQVQQTALNRLVLRVRRGHAGFSEESRRELENRLLRLLGNDMILEWQFDVPFLQVPTGKHVYFLSHV